VEVKVKGETMIAQIMSNPVWIVVIVLAAAAIGGLLLSPGEMHNRSMR